MTQDYDEREKVCLCGSTRFSKAYRAANLQHTLAGRIVLSIGCDTRSDAGLKLSAGRKARLDALHLDKIYLADLVHILDVGGYVGESTRKELQFARQERKPVLWMEQPEDLSLWVEGDDILRLHMQSSHEFEHPLGTTGWGRPPSCADYHFFVSGESLCNSSVLWSEYDRPFLPQRPPGGDSVVCPPCDAIYLRLARALLV